MNPEGRIRARLQTMAELDCPRLWEVQAPAIREDRTGGAGGRSKAELDPFDDRDRVESLLPLLRHVAVVIP